MTYPELGKLYYGDEETYHATYEQRLTSSDTTILPFKIKGNPAFFVQTSEISKLVFQILRLDKKITSIRRDLPGIAIRQFTRRCLIDEIIVTNQIEGVHSTRREIASVLGDLENQVNEQHRRKRFHGLTAKYLKLQTTENVPLQSCADIRALYDEIVLPEVMEEDPHNAPDGKLFRKDSASITTVTGKEIHQGVYPEAAIEETMERALAFLNAPEDGGVEMLFRIAIFHYYLEYIHPFYDGNGRLGRFIVSYLLSKELDSLMAYRISMTIIENISAYYQAFKVCNDPHNLGDVTPFLQMMLTMIHKSAVQLLDGLEKRQIRLERYEAAIETLPFGTEPRINKAYYVLIQAELFSEKGISTQELQDYLEVTYSTVKKMLDKIQSTGLLKKSHVGRKNVYALKLELLDQQLEPALAESKELP